MGKPDARPGPCGRSLLRGVSRRGRRADRAQSPGGRAPARLVGADAGHAWLRLLLDEMYPASLAEQLRLRGHDVSAVTERPELRSLPDADVFAVAQQEGRAVMTENIAD